MRLTPEQINELPPAPEGTRHLNLVSRCVVNDDAILNNIRHAMSLNLPEMGCAVVRNNGDFIICGSGPSIEGELESIRQWKSQEAPVCSLNDSHDYLINKGIIPDIQLMLDPTEQLADRVTPQEGVIYLIASQCHAKVFEKLKGFAVVLWHAWAMVGEENIIGERMRVGGATTVGLRALNVGYLLGFGKFHLYGLDSSLKEDKLRITGEGAKTTMQIVCGDRKFLTNPAMAGQANDVSQAIEHFDGKIRVKAYGDGLLQHVLKERERLGHKDW